MKEEIYDKNYIKRFLDIIEEVKKNITTKTISCDFYNRVLNVLRKEKYHQFFIKKMKELNIQSITFANNFSTREDAINVDYSSLTREIVFSTHSKEISSSLLNSLVSFEKKEEENMFKILEIYEEKKTKAIEFKYDKQLEELEASDPISVYLKQTEEAIKEMLNSENVKLVLHTDTLKFTQETLDKREEIIDTIREEKTKLKTQIEEIQALLELAPNYEEKLQILRDYGIIDKRKNIIL